MMTPQQIARTLQDRFGDKIIAAFPDDKHPRVHVNAQDWRAIAEFLVREPSLKLDWLANHSGVDYVADEQFCVVHDLWSFDHRHSFAVKVYCPRGNPVVPSVADLWPAADWHEREAFDLLGIDFPGHPDLRRILCADDWEGYPLRKDYQMPLEYHGMRGM
jgi:NADH-quinone oxidoreductase subunit C